jgi:hypothetical protein
MTYRRHFLTLAAASALLPLSARAQAADKAAAFVKSTGDRLVAIVNGPGTMSTGSANSALAAFGVRRLRSSKSSILHCSTMSW